ncbi:MULTISPECIES: rhodanese-like domain-containing protein [unclassified Luteococcus]|uniref:rhodanese-like domain-containing protein n=1 Tax=unclassified Luteococcus TaxID=2639923 RepID=UPI00313F2A97
MTDHLPQIAAAELADDAVILDVRADDQWEQGHAPGAVHIPIDQLAARLTDLPTTQGPLPVTCGGGTKAKRATALLREHGIDAAELTGGMRGWKAAGRPLVQE